MTKYNELLKDPRWQRKRLEIFERDDFTCMMCFATDTPLAVHHRVYHHNVNPWEYNNDLLVTLCENCHREEYENRSKLEKEILYELRKFFFYNELIELLFSLTQFKPQAPTEVVMSALTEVIRYPDMQRLVLEEYHKRSRERLDKKNAEQTD